LAAGTVVLESHPALATAVFVAVGGAPPESCAYPGRPLVRTPNVSDDEVVAVVGAWR